MQALQILENTTKKMLVSGASLSNSTKRVKDLQESLNNIEWDVQQQFPFTSPS
jgi:hypothetical protein